MRKKLLWFGIVLVVAGTAGARPRKVTPPQPRPVSAIEREMLSIHNAVRAELKLPPLQWSSSLAAFSQKWANTLAASNRTAHNPNSPYGENIFVSGIGSSPSTVVKEWASESRDYSYQSNACRTDCGHYTQIVWRHSARIGCAVARGARREVWVCSYDPPGNYTNEWPY
jgi:pathogenesis-related protein 1